MTFKFEILKMEENSIISPYIYTWIQSILHSCGKLARPGLALPWVWTADGIYGYKTKGINIMNHRRWYLCSMFRRQPLSSMTSLLYTLLCMDGYLIVIRTEQNAINEIIFSCLCEMQLCMTTCEWVKWVVVFDNDDIAVYTYNLH